jgi:hypothetical protein
MAARQVIAPVTAGEKERWFIRLEIGNRRFSFTVSQGTAHDLFDFSVVQIDTGPEAHG